MVGLCLGAGIIPFVLNRLNKVENESSASHVCKATVEVKSLSFHTVYNTILA